VTGAEQEFKRVEHDGYLGVHSELWPRPLASQIDIVDLELILGHWGSKLYYFCVNDPNCMAKSMIGVAK
jgi:hypothetical protein